MQLIDMKKNSKKRKFWDEVEEMIITNLQQIRLEKGFVQEDIAERLDRSPGYVGGIEAGKNSFSLRAQLKFAAVLGVPRMEFYRLTDKYERELLNLYRKLVDMGHGDEVLSYCRFLIRDYSEGDSERKEKIS